MSTTKQQVKDRDGWKCVDCGMTEKEHKAYFMRGLHVHRKTPTLGYTVDNCDTVCDKCHKARHGARAFGARKPRTCGYRVIQTRKQWPVMPLSLDARSTKLLSVLCCELDVPAWAVLNLAIHALAAKHDMNAPTPVKKS